MAEHGLSPVNVFRSDPRHAQSVLFSADGEQLFTAGQGRRIKVWETTGWTVVDELRGHQATSVLMGWTAAGQLVSAGSDHTVRTWDVGAGDEIFVLDKAVWAGPRPGGRELLVERKNGRLALHSLEDGRELALWPKLDGRVVSLAWHPGGEQVLVGGVGELTVLDGETGEPAGSWEGHAGWVTALAADPAGEVIASLGHDGRFVRWDPEGEVLDASHVPEGIAQLAWHPDGSALAFAGEGHLFVLSMPDGGTLAEEQLEVKGLYGLAWDPAGRHLANAAADGRIRVWRWDDPR